MVSTNPKHVPWHKPRPRGIPEGYQEPKPPGRSLPPYQPTDDDRRKVRLLAGFGLKREEICMMMLNPSTGMPIAVNTLVAYFRFELDVGMSEADAQVMQSYFRQCIGAKAEYDAEGNCVREEVKPSVTAQIFWLKARRGWRENINLNLNGKIAVGTPAEISAMSDAELDEALRTEVKAAQLLLEPPRKKRSNDED